MDSNLILNRKIKEKYKSKLKSKKIPIEKEKIFKDVKNDKEYEEKKKVSIVYDKLMNKNSKEIIPEKIDENIKNIYDIEDAFLDFSEMVELRKYYDDFIYGHYVISMKNPDYETLKDKGITLKGAMEMFDEDIGII